MKFTFSKGFHFALIGVLTVLSGCQRTGSSDPIKVTTKDQCKTLDTILSSSAGMGYWINVDPKTIASGTTISNFNQTANNGGLTMLNIRPDGLMFCLKDLNEFGGGDPQKITMGLSGLFSAPNNTSAVFKSRPGLPFQDNNSREITVNITGTGSSASLTFPPWFASVFLQGAEAIASRYSFTFYPVSKEWAYTFLEGSADGNFCNFPQAKDDKLY